MGNLLSGGEQQMLAIGRALMTNPRLLILDEATEGLAPLIRAEIWRCLTRLKAPGQSILVIDKNVEALTRIADRHYLIERGRVVEGFVGACRRPTCSIGILACDCRARRRAHSARCTANGIPVFSIRIRHGSGLGDAPPAGDASTPLRGARSRRHSAG